MTLGFFAGKSLDELYLNRIEILRLVNQDVGGRQCTLFFVCIGAFSVPREAGRHNRVLAPLSLSYSLTSLVRSLPNFDQAEFGLADNRRDFSLGRCRSPPLAPLVGR